MKFPATDIEFAMQDEIDALRAERDKLKEEVEEKRMANLAWFETANKIAATNVKLVERVNVLEDALRIADISINPPDRDGISLNIWNARLAGATSKIRAALRTSEEA